MLMQLKNFLAAAERFIIRFWYVLPLQRTATRVRSQVQKHNCRIEDLILNFKFEILKKDSNERGYSANSKKDAECILFWCLLSK